MQLTSDIKEKGGARILSNSIAALEEQVIKRAFKRFVHFFRSIHLAVQVYAPPALLAGERVRERPRPRGNPLGPLHLFFFLDELKNWLANVWKWKTRTKRYPAWSAPSDFFLDELKLWLWKSMNVRPDQWVWNSTGTTSKSHWFSLSHLDKSKEYQTKKSSTKNKQKRRHQTTWTRTCIGSSSDGRFCNFGGSRTWKRNSKFIQTEVFQKNCSKPANLTFRDFSSLFLNL